MPPHALSSLSLRVPELRRRRISILLLPDLIMRPVLQEHIRVLTRRVRLEQSPEAFVHGVRVDVLEVLELPFGACGLLVATALALFVLEVNSAGLETGMVMYGKEGGYTYLDLTLLPAGKLKVALPDPLRDEIPQLPALPLVLILDRRNRDLFLRSFTSVNGSKTAEHKHKRYQRHPE